MTDRLYYTDSYLCDFEASVSARADDSRRIYLDRTAFYPTSGGQPFDTGQLGGVEVVDVVDEGDNIAHLLAEPLTTSVVRGLVHWKRRFDHMQQHTGQHLLSAVFAEQMGHQTVAVHFGSESSTLDLEAGSVTRDETDRAEELANEIIVQNRPVEVGFEEASLAIGLRKRPDRAGRIRIITIQGLDRSACGGTHVRATGEIGSLLIRKIERVRKAVRIEFVCGARAVKRAHTDYALISGLAAELSAAPQELPRLITAQKEELKHATAVQRELEERVDLCRARELYAATAAEATGIRRVVVREEQGSIDALRGLAQAFTSMPMAIFVGAVSSPASVVLAVSEDSGIDAAAMLRSLLTSVGGRGGGSNRMAQGIVPGKGQLDTVLGSLGPRV
jgi:alanyl-tRNA synthetase